jgi:hypothetical protein
MGRGSTNRLLGQSPMDSADLSPEQAEKMHGSLFPLTNYLHRLVRRMEKRGFPPDDPLFQRASRAYDETRSLLVELHYLSCSRGVGKPERG